MASEHHAEPIRLAALREDDAPVLHAWRQDPAVRDGALGFPFPTTVEAEVDWIRSFNAKGQPQNVCFALRDTADDSLRGYAQLRAIDWVARVAEFGLVIGDVHTRGKGIGTSAVRLVREYAVSTLGLRRLWLRVAEYNVVAIKLYERAGFSFEGKLNRHVYSNGRLYDLVLYGWEFEREQPSSGT